MAATQGSIDVKKLKYLVENDEVETVLTVFPDMYGRLMGKRIAARFFLDEVLTGAIHACNYLLACDMEMDPTPGYQFTSWEKGYGDFRLMPDLKTLRHATWLEKTAIVFCDVFAEDDDVRVDIAPRNILQKQVDNALDQGYLAMGASELEFYVFKETYEEAARKNYTNLETMSDYIEDYHILQGSREEFIVGAIRHHMERSGVPVEFSKGEWGPGQQEINLRYSNFLEMADRHTIYKHAAKEIAAQKECSISYMAKWDERFAGSSMHIHASLWDKSGSNSLFAGKDKIAGVHASPLFRWFLGGWMAHAREICAFYAPFPTSYKRFVAGSFAPTSIAWSYDNRTAGFRIVGRGPSLRIECRVPGADSNPYLAFAVTLAAGLDGIKNQIEPPDIIAGNSYATQGLPQVPMSLSAAIAELSNSSWARNALGEQVVEHYLHFFRTEQQKFDEVVTSWERARYFERS